MEGYLLPVPLVLFLHTETIFQCWKEYNCHAKMTPDTNFSALNFMGKHNGSKRIFCIKIRDKTDQERKLADMTDVTTPKKQMEGKNAHEGNAMTDSYGV
jgi:hypothetical protein